MKRIIVIIIMIALNLPAETMIDDLFDDGPVIKKTRMELMYINPMSCAKYPKGHIFRLVYTNSVLHDYSASITLKSYKTKGNKTVYFFNPSRYFCKITKDEEVFSFSLYSDDQLNEKLKKNIDKGFYLIFADFGKSKELYNVKVYSMREFDEKFRYAYDDILKYLKEEKRDEEFKITHAMLKEVIINSNLFGYKMVYYQDLVDMGYEKMTQLSHRK